jgi:hypothetical protein
MDPKETQAIDLTQTVEVPAEGGGVTRKRLMDLTPADLEALGRRYREDQARGRREGPDAE